MIITQLVRFLTVSFLCSSQVRIWETVQEWQLFLFPKMKFTRIFRQMTLKSLLKWESSWAFRTDDMWFLWSGGNCGRLAVISKMIRDDWFWEGRMSRWTKGVKRYFIITCTMSVLVCFIFMKCVDCWIRFGWRWKPVRFLLQSEKLRLKIYL